MNKKHRQTGFTLVELMIVIAVIAILATLGLVGFRSAQQSARDTQRLNNMRGVQAALECYLSVNGLYPAASDFNWNDPASIDNMGSCWSGGTNFSEKPAGDTVAAGVGATGTIGRSGVADVGQYVYVVGADRSTYTITLNGESRTMSVESPN